jgi:hypothetical protein
LRISSSTSGYGLQREAKLWTPIRRFNFCSTVEKLIRSSKEGGPKK